jgi:transposase
MKHKDEIKKLFDLGYSYSQIQKELGCSKGTISYHVGVGQKNKSLKRTRDRRDKIKKYIQEYKQGKSCTDCKEDYPYWILEFDHLKNKKFNISEYRTKTISLDIVKEEIEKCEIVCSNCHKNRTYLRLQNVGSNSMNVLEFY